MTMSESMRQSISPQDMTGLLSSLATHQHWYFVHISGKLGRMEVDCFIMFVQSLFMPSTPPSMNAIRKWCLDGFSVLAYQLQESEELSLTSQYHLEKDDVPRYFVHRIIDYCNRPSTNMDRVESTNSISENVWDWAENIHRAMSLLLPCFWLRPYLATAEMCRGGLCCVLGLPSAEVGCVLKQNTWHQDRCQRLRQTRQDKTQNHVGCNLWFSHFSILHKNLTD